MNALEVFKQGGFIMYPLLVFSVLILAIAVQKLSFLHSFTSEHEKINGELNRALEEKKFDDFKYILRNASAPIARPHEILMDEVYQNKTELEEKLGRRLSETNSALKKNLWVLGTIGSSAPFVGLFGTVLGIMESFRAIGATGKSGFSVVAGGISESLIATAAGIIVAVIAVLFYNYFQTRVNALAQDFRHRVEDIADLIFLIRGTRK